MEEGRDFAAAVHYTHETLLGEQRCWLIDGVWLAKRLWPRARPLPAAVPEALVIYLTIVRQETELDAAGDWLPTKDSRIDWKGNFIARLLAERMDKNRKGVQRMQPGGSVPDSQTVSWEVD